MLSMQRQKHSLLWFFHEIVDSNRAGEPNCTLSTQGDRDMVETKYCEGGGKGKCRFEEAKACGWETGPGTGNLPKLWNMAGNCAGKSQG